MSECRPIQIAFAVISRSGNIVPFAAEDRIVLFRESHDAVNHQIVGDRVTRVWVFEDDPRIAIDALRSQLQAQSEELRGVRERFTHYDEIHGCESFHGGLCTCNRDGGS